MEDFKCSTQCSVRTLKDNMRLSHIIVQAFYGQKLVNLPQIATEANSTDMIS